MKSDGENEEFLQGQHPHQKSSELSFDPLGAQELP